MSQYHKPDSVERRCACCGGASARAVAAGGRHGAAGRIRHAGAQAVVDLSGLGLDYIRQDGPTLEIGAMTTLQTLRRLAGLAGYRRRAAGDGCAQPATRTIRNAATIGGSIWPGAGVLGCCGALLALEATVMAASGAS